MEKKIDPSRPQTKPAPGKISTHSLADAPLLRPTQSTGETTTSPQASGGDSAPSGGEPGGGTGQGGGEEG